MLKRSATLLFGALLALSAAAAIPSQRVNPGPAGYSIVWIAPERAESESVKLPRRFGSTSATVFFPQETPRPARIFSRSLYQRPPPR
jgi:hypothetical protein